MELNKMNRYWDENDKVHGECGKKIHELEHRLRNVETASENLLIFMRKVIPAELTISGSDVAATGLAEQLTLLELVLDIDPTQKKKPYRCGCGEIHSSNERCGKF
jgi:hypothetical protein